MAGKQTRVVWKGKNRYYELNVSKSSKKEEQKFGCFFISPIFALPNQGIVHNLLIKGYSLAQLAVHPVVNKGFRC